MDTKNINKNNLKLRVFTIFRSSCRDASLSDITAPSSNPSLLHHHPKHPFPSITKKPMTPTTIIPSKPDPARQKLSESYSLFYSAHSAPLLEKQSMDRTKKKKKKHARRRRTRTRTRNASFWSNSEEDENDEKDSLLMGTRGMKKKKKMVELDQEQHQRRHYEMGMEDSYAVVKCSNDPYMDFRTSMVEMIVKKRMKKAEDLERLLQCFLKLNSYRHHPVIIEAFMDIWDALFL